MNTYRYSFKRAFQFISVLICAVTLSLQAQTLTDISVDTSTPGVALFKITSSESFDHPPASFAMSSPPRVIVDLPGTSKFKHNRMTVNKYGVKALLVVESTNRTRLIAQLEENLPYTLSTNNSQLSFAVGKELQSNLSSTSINTSPVSTDSQVAGGRLSLNFQNIEIRSVLQLLADFTGLNMVVSDTVGGNITLRLKDVHWKEAMDIILETKGLTSRMRGNVIMVAPTAEVLEREQLEAESKITMEKLAPLVSRTVRVKYGKATEFVDLIEAGSGGNQGSTLLSDRGSITADERTNSLLIHDTTVNLKKILALIRTLDKPIRQVMIESRIVIANDDFARDIGVRFGISGGGRDAMISGGKPGHIGNTGDVDVGTFMESVNATIVNDGGDADDAQNLMVNLPATIGGEYGGAVNLLLGRVGSFLLQLELSAMQREGKGEIISSPRVITTDQKKAVILQGVEIPYEKSTSSGATSVTFKEAVLKLEVTPQITPDNNVIMDLEVNKDARGEETSAGPSIDARRVQTTVLVGNGETVVLGGIFEHTKTKSENKIPVLGDLPAVGRLFRRDYDVDTKRELLVFVTPKILNSKR